MEISFHVKVSFSFPRITMIGTLSPAVMKKEASMTSSGWCTFVLPTCSRMSPGFDPGISRRRSRQDLGQSARVDPSTAVGRLRDIDTHPTMPRFTEAHEIAANFFRGIDRQRVTGGPVVHAADENADHFAFEIEHAARRLHRAALADLPADAWSKNSGRETCDRIPRSSQSWATSEDRAENQSSTPESPLPEFADFPIGREGVGTSTFRIAIPLRRSVIT